MVADPNPGSIVLNGSGNTFFLTQPDSQLDGIQLIDIRGTGDNTLMLDAGRIRDVFVDGTILVLSDAGDEVVFDDGWEFSRVILESGQLIRRFTQPGAELNLVGPDDFTNPISEFDVNASGTVTSVDALQIINELGRRAFSDANSSPRGQLRNLSTVDLTRFRFYDVSRDLRITALDALRVINELGRRSNFSGELVETGLVAAAITARVVDEPMRSIQLPVREDLSTEVKQISVNGSDTKRTIWLNSRSNDDSPGRPSSPSADTAAVDRRWSRCSVRKGIESRPS